MAPTIRITWSETRTRYTLSDPFLVIAEIDESGARFAERSSWEIRWYERVPTTLHRYLVECGRAHARQYVDLTRKREFAIAMCAPSLRGFPDVHVSDLMVSAQEVNYIVLQAHENRFLLDGCAGQTVGEEGLNAVYS
jgi:hypothetical protein